MLFSNLRRPVAGLAAAAAVLTVAAGCGGDPYESYCGTVESQRQELSTTLAEGGTTALFDALETMRVLREEAPEDIRGDWNTLIGAIEGLEDALEEAGVDPAEYERSAPSEGGSDGADSATGGAVTPAERAEIDAAARRLGNATTARASERIQQQARDVCGTPLTL